MFEALGDVIVLSMLLCIGLTVIAFKLRSLPVMVLSSLGWVVVAGEIFTITESLLPLALIYMLAIAQPFLVVSK